MNRLVTSSKWSRIAITLVSTTLVYNVLEAIIALWSGSVAASIALISFGLDSGIETAAAVVMLYRLWVEYRGADGERVARIEHRVHQFIGATFLLLAAYVTGQAGWTLWKQEAPSSERTGQRSTASRGQGNISLLVPILCAVVGTWRKRNRGLVVG